MNSADVRGSIAVVLQLVDDMDAALLELDRLLAVAMRDAELAEQVRRLLSDPEYHGGT